MSLMDQYLSASVPQEMQPQTQPTGRKDDKNKVDMSLVMNDLPHALEGVAQVLQWAITSKKPVPYARGSWQGVEDFYNRYNAALIRHQLNAAKAKLMNPSEHHQFLTEKDAETELLEIQHIATDAMFLCEMALRMRARNQMGKDGIFQGPPADQRSVPAPAPAPLALDDMSDEASQQRIAKTLADPKRPRSGFSLAGAQRDDIIQPSSMHAHLARR